MVWVLLGLLFVIVSCFWVCLLVGRLARFGEDLRGHLCHYLMLMMMDMVLNGICFGNMVIVEVVFVNLVIVGDLVQYSSSPLRDDVEGNKVVYVMSEDNIPILDVITYLISWFERT